MNKFIRIRSFSINTSDEILPHSSFKKISEIGKEVLNSSQENVEKYKTPKKIFPKIIKPKCNGRFNEVNIQMISQKLYDQLFSDSPNSEISENLIKRLQQDLIQHGMLDSKIESQPNIEFKLPSLKGKNIEEHFANIAEEQSAPYRNLLDKLISNELPEMPLHWAFCSGWTRYGNTGNEQVEYPQDEVLVFDVEVCMAEGKLPTMACAVSNDAWYSWCSQSLIDNIESSMINQHLTTDLLIPLESNKNQKPQDLEYKDLIPRIVVGHNISYDRARIKEQYWLQNTALRFMDTMSLHVCISGITSYQRAMLSSKSTKEPSYEDQFWMSQASLNSLTEVYKLYCDKSLDKLPRNVFVDGTLNDIRQDFQNLMKYCANDVLATYDVFKQMFPLFKERFPHPATLSGMLEIGSAYLPVNSNWLRYISDCESTFEDLNLEAKFLLSRRANEACKLQHNEKYKNDLWMWDQDWSSKSIKLKKSVKTKIKKSGNNNCATCFKSDNKAKDKIEDRKAIISNLPADQLNIEEINDESEDNFEALAKKFSNIFELKYSLPLKRPLLPGYPGWYTKLCEKPSEDPNWIQGPQNISTSMQITPKLLRLSWEGYPLHYIRGHGWGFIVPHKSDLVDHELGQLPIRELLQKCPVVIPSNLCATEAQSELVFDGLWKSVEDNISKKDYWKKPRKKVPPYQGTGVWCNVNLEECAWFIRLPHKDGVSKKVGNPLSRDFLNKFSENILAGDDRCAETVIHIARKLSYWKNNHDRIKQQMVIWLKNKELQNIPSKLGMQFGAIIPQIVVCGTLTRRAMEATWLTASNAQSDRLGSELRAMIQAPPGYSLIGADVDSQELWIASVIGDSHAAGIHGATPFGWMTLSGTKSEGTDMHSVTAKAIGISRDHAKVINYARIYGAGQNFAEQLLKQFNPMMDSAEARNKARKMFSLTKGKRVYYLKKDVDLENEVKNSERGFTGYEALKMAAANGKSVTEMFGKPKWEGGTESAMFNRLEEIAGSPSPVTPFLECKLSRALEPNEAVDNDRFLPTRINWVVQSGAVDYLHLMLVSMRHLMGKNLRFCLSFHDEVRYLVKDENKYESALAMHITNLLTRAFCVHRLGLKDLPQSIAFFSSVEVDKVLRKEATADCITPSNPRGLQAAYGIPPGESLDIVSALKKAEEEKSKRIKQPEENKIGARKNKKVFVKNNKII